MPFSPLAYPELDPLRDAIEGVPRTILSALCRLCMYAMQEFMDARIKKRKYSSFSASSPTKELVFDFPIPHHINNSAESTV
jgi:hypothetical protein